MKNDMKQCVYLETQSYSVGVHYYACLVGKVDGKYTKIQLEYPITAAQARRFNVHDRDTFEWKKGHVTSRFWSEEDAKDKALEVYKTHFPDATILIHGSISVLEPQEIVDGPKKYKEQVNELVKLTDELGYHAWDKHPKEMKGLCGEWKALNEKYKVVRF